MSDAVTPDSDAESDHHAFWADDIADQIEARDPTEPVVIKGGVSPSGVPHLGHFNEIMLGYYVAEVLRERGHAVRQVFTSDDRDALRKVPRTLATAEFELVGLDAVDAGALGRNLGKPYTAIPDPFEDCSHDSYGDHFTDLLQRAAASVDVPVEMVSNTDLYESGAFEAVTRQVLARRDRAREVLAKYQDGVDEDYVPFMPQCSECGRLTTDVRGVDLDAVVERTGAAGEVETHHGTVDYVCSGLTAGGQEIDGCGHEGTATVREGKLPWRFEWPAQWRVLDVDFEPFGKDHAEGSWPSGEEIAREVLDWEPPVPMTYEWFTLNGEPLSSSAGNVVTVKELTDLLEVEVIRYFFVRDPGKARDLDLDRLDLLVDEFDRFERLYFGEETDPDIGPLAERAYPFVPSADTLPTEATGAETERTGPETGEIARFPDVETKRAFVTETFRDRVRLPYTFAAVLGMTDDRDLRVRMARNEAHLAADTPQWAVETALGRVEKARRWAERTDNEYNYRLQATLPDCSFDDDVAAALADLAEFVAEGHDGEEIQGAMYETARDHGVEVSDFFTAGYRLFFDETQGPRLGEFLGELDREFVVRRLRRED